MNRIVITKNGMDMLNKIKSQYEEEEIQKEFQKKIRNQSKDYLNNSNEQNTNQNSLFKNANKFDHKQKIQLMSNRNQSLNAKDFPAYMPLTERFKLNDQVFKSFVQNVKEEIYQSNQNFKDEQDRIKKRINLKQISLDKQWQKSNFIQNQKRKYNQLLNSLEIKREQQSKDQDSKVSFDQSFLSRQKIIYDKQLQRVKQIK